MPRAITNALLNGSKFDNAANRPSRVRMIAICSPSINAATPVPGNTSSIAHTSRHSLTSLATRGNSTKACMDMIVEPSDRQHRQADLACFDQASLLAPRGGPVLVALAHESHTRVRFIGIDERAEGAELLRAVHGGFPLALIRADDMR